MFEIYFIPVGRRELADGIIFQAVGNMDGIAYFQGSKYDLVIIGFRFHLAAIGFYHFSFLYDQPLGTYVINIILFPNVNPLRVKYFYGDDMLLFGSVALIHHLLRFIYK